PHRRRGHAEALLAARFRFSCDELRQAPQAAPYARGRAFLERDRAAMPNDEPGRLPDRRRPCRPRRRKTLYPAGAARDTRLLNGTSFAAGARARADHGAEVHEPLRVSLDLARRSKGFGELPQACLDGRRAGPAFDAEAAREHALHVAIENGRALAKSERGDR